VILTIRVRIGITTRYHNGLLKFQSRSIRTVGLYLFYSIHSVTISNFRFCLRETFLICERVQEMLPTYNRGTQTLDPICAVNDVCLRTRITCVTVSTLERVTRQTLSSSSRAGGWLDGISRHGSRTFSPRASIRRCDAYTVFVRGTYRKSRAWLLEWQQSDAKG